MFTVSGILPDNTIDWFQKDKLILIGGLSHKREKQSQEMPEECMGYTTALLAGHQRKTRKLLSQKVTQRLGK